VEEQPPMADPGVPAEDQPPMADPGVPAEDQPPMADPGVLAEDQPPMADPGASSSEILEAAILAESEMIDDEGAIDAVEFDFSEPMTQPQWGAPEDETPKPAQSSGEALRIVSTGTAQVDSEGSLRIPLVLGDESGKTHSVVLSLRLDTLLEDGND
jgi:hypothetical protein